MQFNFEIIIHCRTFVININSDGNESEFEPVNVKMDRTPTSVQVISANIKAAKEVFDSNKFLLQQFAEEQGVKKYTIHWVSNDKNIEYNGGYSVEIE